jgi:hypothetical protein
MNLEKLLTDKKISVKEYHAARISEHEHAKRNVEYFIAEYVKIEDRDVKGEDGIVIPFTLWSEQKNALSKFITDRLVQVLKANQLGLTWLILAFATWRLLFNPGYLVLGISETEIKAKELVRRIDFILRHLPFWMIVGERNSKGTWYESTALTITIHHPLKNGKQQEASTIQAFASSPTAGASFTANLFLFDEWALQQWAREIWTYAYPTINRPTGGQVIGISTIERGTLFEDIWKNAKNGFTKIFLNWKSDPRRTQEWYDKTVEDIGLDETHKHYPLTEEEAFAIPGGAFFREFRSDIHLKPTLFNIPLWYTKYRTLDYGLDCLACYWIYIDTQGFARIYKEVHKEGLIISRAAYEILKMSGAKVPEVEKWDSLTREEKQAIALTQTDKVALTYAPPDLFNRAKDTGRSNAEIWSDNGIDLVRTKNAHEASLVLMSQWLHPIVLKNEQTGEPYTTAMLTIDGDLESNCAPELVHSLVNIQKDKHNSNVYAEHPHILTHSIAAVKGFCVEYAMVPKEPEKPKPLWVQEMMKEEPKYSEKSFMSV